jgi:hypothetical protein
VSAPVVALIAAVARNSNFEFQILAKIVDNISPMFVNIACNPQFL